MKNELIIKFNNQSESFAHGVEFGRLLQKMETNQDVIENNGFPVRIENIELLKNSCKVYGYIPSFGKEYLGEWVDFLGIKKTTTDN